MPHFNDLQNEMIIVVCVCVVSWYSCMTSSTQKRKFSVCHCYLSVVHRLGLRFYSMYLYTWRRINDGECNFVQKLQQDVFTY